MAFCTPSSRAASVAPTNRRHAGHRSALINVDSINVDRTARRARTMDLMTTLIDVPAGLNGVAVTDTSIGDVDGEAGFFHYRGHDATDLARHHGFEEAWHLVAVGHLPTPPSWRRFRAAVAAERVAAGVTAPRPRAAGPGHRRHARTGSGGRLDRRRRARAAPADRPRPRRAGRPGPRASPPSSRRSSPPCTGPASGWSPSMTPRRRPRPRRRLPPAGDRRACRRRPRRAPSSST